MASNQPIDPAGPLSTMKSLSPVTFLYEPSSDATDPDAPQLIVVFTWMAAQDVHIAKYTSRYTSLYPTSRLLLVKCPFAHIFFPRNSKRDIKPAVSVVRALADASPRTETGKPPLLFHVFSNGGATNLAKFYDLYAAEDNNRGGRLELPPHVTVYDSCPGGFHWARTHRALSAALPKFLSPLAHVMVAWFWLMQRPLGRRKGVFGKMWIALNQQALLASEKRRVYLYSREDEIIHWADVEKHADEAKDAGFQVSRVRFEGSRHVAHARLDAEKYWGAVKELWDGRGDGEEDAKKAKVKASLTPPPTIQ